MKSLERLLSFIVVLCIAVSLAACGSKDNTSAQTTQGTVTGTAEASTTPADNSNDPAAKYKPYDMGGRTITIAMNYDVVPANSDYVFDPAKDADYVKKNLENMKRVEQKYNCKIQYINLPYDQRIEKVTTTVMAGSPVADIMGLDIAQILPLAVNDMLLAYDDIVPANADILNEQKVLAPQGKLFNKIYAVDKQGLPVVGDYLMLNLDIINSLGLSANPVDLNEKGEWTWDKMMEIAKAATKDTDGDGKIDQFGISGPPSSILNMLVASNGGAYFDDQANKQLLDTPETMQALDQFNKIYKVDKVGMISNNLADWNANLNSFKEGKSAMFYAADWAMPDGENKPAFKFAPVAMAKGPSSKGDERFMKAMAGMSILKGVKDPGYVYQVYEELTVPADLDFEAVAQGTRDWLSNKFLTEADIERTFKICGDGAKYDASTGIPGFPTGDIVGGIIEKGKTPAQAVEENKQIAQDKINAIFKK